MTFTYDLATTTGRARLYIPDRVQPEATWTDEELAAFALVEGDDPRLVAAAALEAMAANDAYLLKKTRLPDISTDGPAVADALLKRAATLRQQAFDEVDSGAFDVAEVLTTPFALREELLDVALREAG